MSVCQPPLQSHREGASHTAAGIDPCGYVEASISTFLLIFFSKISPSMRVCHCVSVSATFTEQREGSSQPATVIVLCGYVEASFDFSTDFFFTNISFRESVSLWQCVSYLDRARGRVYVRQQLALFFVAMWRL